MIYKIIFLSVLSTLIAWAIISFWWMPLIAQYWLDLPYIEYLVSYYTGLASYSYFFLDVIFEADTMFQFIRLVIYWYVLYAQFKIVSLVINYFK